MKKLYEQDRETGMGKMVSEYPGSAENLRENNNHKPGAVISARQKIVPPLA